MALNKYMHPRNPYKARKPDFRQLAAKYDYFKDKVTENAGGKVILDFKDPAALRALTRALLENDFGLQVALPLDRLIPTVPQRLNYILWLEDIIGQNKPVKGIDIGTGASCIYPLLGCRQNGWQFLASEVDDQNIFFAEKNIQQNKMTDKITVKKVPEDTLLEGFLPDSSETFDFSMCNPPFFTDHLEAQGLTTSRSIDRPEPKSLSTASETEGVAWGGEVRFVTQMIEESLHLSTRIRVYTSLLGKKNSLQLLKEVLRTKKVPKYATTEFCQGRTMRWGIAWTFDDSVTFPKSEFKEQKKSKLPLVYNISRDAGVLEEYTVPAYTYLIRKHIDQLQVRFYTKHSGKFYTCLILQAKTNTWSHQRRKRRQQIHLQSVGKMEDSSGNKTEIKNTVKQSNEKSDNDMQVDHKMNQNNLSATEVDEMEEGCASGQEKDKECLVSVKGGAHEDAVVAVKDKSIVGEDSQQSQNDRNGKGVDQDDDVDIDSKNDDSGVFVEDTSRSTDDCSRNRKRVLDDNKPDSTVKKFKVANEDECTSQNLKGHKAVVESSSVGGNTSAADNSESNGNPQQAVEMLSRKKVVEQFWKEQEQNRVQSEKKKLSFYETLEPFSETEDCLVLCKMVLKKEEGLMSLQLTHIAGNKEATHQIMQYFKNVLSVKAGEKV